MKRPNPLRRGFTLLEVMVSLAILGLGLTAILSAQAGTFASSVTARNISEATGLARCKMSEVEEHLLREGFQELDEADNGPCCEDDESPTMKCSWKIEKLKMPEPQYGQLDLDTELNGMGLGPLGGAGGGPAGLAGAAAGLGAEGDPTAGFAAMLGPIKDIVFPKLQSIFEASTRRVTVSVTWTEGNREQSLEVMQWVVGSGGLAGAEIESASSSSSGKP